MIPRNERIFNRNISKFAQKLDSVQQYTNALQQLVVETSSQAANSTISDALEELKVALEELNQAEEELKIQNEELAIARSIIETERHRYQDLFEFAPDGYLITDDAGIIQEANRAASMLLNLPQSFIIRKPLVTFIPVEERRNFRLKLNHLLQNESMQEWELRILPRAGEIFDAALTVSAIRDLQNKPVGWRWLLRDITVRKKTEEKMRQVELQNLQLQETAKLKSHFLAIMSHELRSPMNAIIGFSQLLLRQSNQLLNPSQQNMVERILNSGRHLLTLIDEILDFSKIEAGRLELHLEEFNLVELVTATVEEMRSLVEQKNLKLLTNINIQNPYIINDSTRKRQILINLLSNAIKFTDFGKIEVEVWELPSNRIAIAVKDTGIGIAEADIQHLFEEFRQLNQSLTRKQSGTGLGLAITDRLVQMMQGKIIVESKPGQGSTFRVELPRQVSN